jgi:HK97 family phage prohead protease
MPWHVAKTEQCPSSKPWGVILDATGEVVDGGCHVTKADALAHMAALYANEPGAKAMTADCLDCHGQRSPTVRGAVDNSTWDGPAAMSACTASDTPASCFGSICAGKKAGDTSTQAAWALPHHKHPGDPPNAAGVRNSLSRLPQTQGLTNKQAAQSHLEAHLSSINAENSAAAAVLRMRGLNGDRHVAPNDGQRRLASFSGQLRAQVVKVGTTEFYEVEGYASVVDTPYTMFDAWGPYDETIKAGAFDDSLARDDLNVAFLVNHSGMPMARTTGDNPTLTLWSDSTGLGARARLNMTRQDVRDLASAIDDELINEMSFAFWLEAGGWNESYDKFTIYSANIHRGDVSAVNFGANPYTSIGARAPQILDELDRLPLGAARAALVRLQSRDGVTIGGLDVPTTGNAEVAVMIARTGTHGIFTGTHNHSHAANGSQGSDWQHSHEHSHDGDGDHGHAHGNAAAAEVERQDTGPEPYHKDPDETVQCPSCDRYNSPDAIYCDQCGAKLPPSAYANDAAPALPTRSQETSAPPPASGMSVEMLAELARLDDEHDADSGLPV